MKIYEFQKNALEKVIIEISEYEGKEYLSIRVWYDVSKGQNVNWRPSQKGITIAVELLRELQTGVNLSVRHISSDESDEPKKEMSKKQNEKEWINEKAKWIYENSICLDSNPHETRHPITVKASIDFIKQLLQETRGVNTGEEKRLF